MYTFVSFISLFILFARNELVAGVVDGSNAAEKEFPFQVSFQRDNRHFCGGTIVHSKFVLTAAHCVTGINARNVRIVSGVTNLKKSLKPDNIHTITLIIKHPDYQRPLPKENDIALVKVDRPFKFDLFTKKATLATHDYADDQKVHVTGWGLKSASGTSPTSTLRKAGVYIFNHNQCEEKYKGKLKITDKVFCTINKNVVSNKGVCNGDSGGPVVVNKNILVGVIKGAYHVTDAPQCGSKDYPDMHSRVALYKAWIDGTIASHA